MLTNLFSVEVSREFYHFLLNFYTFCWESMKLSTSEKRYFIIKIRTKTEGDRSPFSSISTFLPFWYDQCLPADNFVTIVYTIRLHNIFYGCTCPIKFIADIPEAVPFFHNISSKYFIFFFFRFSFCFFCGFSFLFLLL